MLQFLPEILLHVSRGVRWDSDHVVILNDDLLAIAREIVANGFVERVHIGLDYFDASINRVAAWTIGTRNMLRALLCRAARTDGPTARRRKRRRLHHAPGVAGRSQVAAVRRGLGLLLRNQGRSRRRSVAGGSEALRKRSFGEPLISLITAD